jgi:hypothetical protein
MNLDWKKNEDYGTFEASLTTELVSISDKTFQFDNENKTEYRVCTVKLEDGQQVSAIMYESNFTHGVKEGNSYAARAIFDPSRGTEDVFLTVSHLAAAKRLTIKGLGLPAYDKTEVKEKEVSTSDSVL